jgi:hypothetical protein
VTTLLLYALAQVAPPGQSWWLSLPALITAVLGGLAGVAALISGFASRRKTDAERIKIYNDVALEMLAPSRESVAFLHAELAAARAEGKAQAEEMAERAEQLGKQLASAQAEVLDLRSQVAELTAELTALRRGA